MDYEQQEQKAIQLDNAIKTNNLSLFKELIEEQQGDDKYLPLETACQYNRLEMAKILIEKGAYIHDGFNSLAYAAGHGNIEFIKYLYEHAQHIGDPYNGTSISQALDSVADAGHVKAMEFILSLYDRSKVTPGYDPIDGEALKQAIDSKHIAMVKALIENGANLHANNNLAIKQAAAMKRQAKPCKKLLSILAYLENVKKDWTLYRAIMDNKRNQIDRLLIDEQRVFSKETRAWLKHGTYKLPAFQYAQKIYRLGIIKHKLQNKLSNKTITTPKAKVNKI
ncbi:MAG: ankyrin repeat domain-containing protein [Herbaspirillum sp.]|uniref:ankyrin repeat domain-containing protein n=1 Tax=Herbaspirillum sp. TaxID=1890675 RepID=UPI00258EF2E0|nr:ankyrin repeat domain-containing protein [Herbaspirillum sp.]MCP3658486.1 ankyrin repeat domain-containing protein [Herbaspirillum sp.]MCP4033839.1 ankyrin repeat domain-containing protein [Herbaspirillum sp.]